MPPSAVREEYAESAERECVWLGEEEEQTGMSVLLLKKEDRLKRGNTCGMVNVELWLKVRRRRAWFLRWRCIRITDETSMPPMVVAFQPQLELELPPRKGMR